jgi:hypothetical protein
MHGDDIPFAIPKAVAKNSGKMPRGLLMINNPSQETSRILPRNIYQSIELLLTSYISLAEGEDKIDCAHQYGSPKFNRQIWTTVFRSRKVLFRRVNLKLVQAYHCAAKFILFKYAN